MQGNSSRARQSNYFDCAFEIGVDNRREYPADTVRSPAGKVHETTQPLLGEPEIETRLKDLQISPMRPGSPGRKILFPEEQSIQHLGHMLCSAFLTGEGRIRYGVSQRQATQQHKGLCLKPDARPQEPATLPRKFPYDSLQAEYVRVFWKAPAVRHLELPFLKRQAWHDLHCAIWNGAWHTFQPGDHTRFDSPIDKDYEVLINKKHTTRFPDVGKLGQSQLAVVLCPVLDLC
jgi:hypothetical protein